MVLRIPMKIRWFPFRRCEKCKKRKLSTTLYEIYNVDSISSTCYCVCKRCINDGQLEEML